MSSHNYGCHADVIDNTELIKVGKCEKYLERLLSIFDFKGQKPLIYAGEKYDFDAYAQNMCYGEFDDIELSNNMKRHIDKCYVDLCTEFECATGGLILSLEHASDEAEGDIAGAYWGVDNCYVETPAMKAMRKAKINIYRANWVEYG